MARAHSRQQLGNVQIVKRKSPDEEKIDERPKAEHVPRLGLVRVGAQRLWAQHPPDLRGAVLEVGGGGRVVQHRNQHLVLEEDVLRGQAAVDDVLGVEVGEGVGHLHQDRHPQAGQVSSPRNGGCQRVSLNSTTNYNWVQKA